MDALKGIPGRKPAGTLETKYVVSKRLLMFPVTLKCLLNLYLEPKSTTVLLGTEFSFGIEP